MNFYHLKYFYDAAKHSSISKAARDNFIGQPAISKAIKSLEQDLNTTLIQHKRNRFQLTEQGVIVYENCQSVFNSVEILKDSINLDQPVSGDINFACQSSMAESIYLSSIIKKISKQYPLLSPNLSLGRTDLVNKWLKEGKIEFALVINNRDFSSFDSKLISKGHFHLVKSKEYKGKWKKDGIMATEDTKEVLSLDEKFSKNESNKLKYKMRIGSWSVIKNFSLSGIGVGFVPDYLIEKEILTKQLQIIEKSKYSIPYEILLITIPDSYLSRKAQCVIKLFE